MNEDQRKILQIFQECKKDPVLFAEKILCIFLWSKQKEIVKAISKHDRVAVKSGHKIGKTRLCAVVALWYACMHKNARVIMTSSSARQVKNILWREIKQLYQNAPLLKLVVDVCNDDPNTGLKFHDGSEILGFSTDEPEKMAGLSGEYLLFIVDEASGVPETIFEAIEGNRAGGAKIVMISNPTRTSGTFYNAFRDPVISSLWKTFSVSSENSPNVTGEFRIPGLATKEWIDEKRIEWGPDYNKNPLYLVRVRGEFPIYGSTTVIPFALYEAALERNVLAQGSLMAGLDPAGEGDDETVLCIRRGYRVLSFVVWSKLDGFAISEKTISELQKHRTLGENVVLNVDNIGLGASAYSALRRLAPDWLHVEGVKASFASTKPLQYVTLRDQLWFNLAEFLKQGSIPKDNKLEIELTAIEYEIDPKGKIKVESKKDLKKRIGRSTDRSDALCLAVFQNSINMNQWRNMAQKLRPKFSDRQKATV